MRPKPEELARRVASFPFWYHRIELPGGVVTPGVNPLAASRYGVPQDLTGKRVLDVGAWDGYWSFEALKRGAREVVAIDDFSDYMGLLKPEDRKAWQTFDLCREAFDFPEERCRRIEMTVYDVSPSHLGTFDVVFFFGALYHLRHPLLALDRLAAICTGQIFVESAILDDYSAYKGGLGPHYGRGDVVMEFYPNDEYGRNSTNWWCPTLECLMRLVYAAGFSQGIRGWKLTDNPSHVGLCRGFATGSRA
jgi:tRNA (mo5U34)-methyltransferase